MLIAEILKKIAQNKELTAEELDQLVAWGSASQASAAQTAQIFTADGDIDNLQQVATHTGELDVDLLTSQNTGSYGKPEDDTFTGAFFDGKGQTFADGTFNVGAVAAGVLQAGFNTAGYLLGAAGAWILGTTGINITGVQFLYNHTATVGAYLRRFRQGFQEILSNAAYLLEFIDDTAASNLITTNSDFETGSLATGYSANTNWAIVTSPVHGGTYAAAIVDTFTNPLTTNKYAVTAGNSYTASYWADSDHAAAVLTGQILWYNAVPTLLQTDTIHSGSNKYGYYQRSATFVAPVGATQAEIKLTPSAGTAGLYVQVDDITLALVSQYAALRLSDAGVEAIDEINTVLLTSTAMKNLGNSGYAYLTEQAALGTPPAGFGIIQFLPDSLPYAINDAGTMFPLFSGTIIGGAAPNGVVAASTTRYAAPYSIIDGASEQTMILPRTGTLKNLYIRTTSVQPGSGSLVITFRLNGSGSALTKTIVNADGSGTFSDTTHTVAVVAGDRISMQFVNNATGNSASISSWSVELW